MCTIYLLQAGGLDFFLFFVCLKKKKALVSDAAFSGSAGGVSRVEVACYVVEQVGFEDGVVLKVGVDGGEDDSCVFCGLYFVFEVFYREAFADEVAVGDEFLAVCVA